MPAILIPAVVAFAPDAQPATAAPPGSLSTVSKNVTSSVEVRTARTPIPSDPHASMTARRVRNQPRRCPPSHCAESRSTHRNSPLPGRSDRSLDRSEKYSRSPGRNSGRAALPGEPGRPGSGNRSSGSGHNAACAGFSRAAVTLAAS